MSITPRATRRLYSGLLWTANSAATIVVDQVISLSISLRLVQDLIPGHQLAMPGKLRKRSPLKLPGERIPKIMHAAILTWIQKSHTLR